MRRHLLLAGTRLPGKDLGQLAPMAERKDQNPGAQVRGVMDDLIADQQVTCDVLNLDRYKRLIAICTVDGRDIGDASAPSIASSAWAK